MPIRIRVTRIDMDGFWGRTPHPPAGLAGSTGTILGVTTDPGDPALLVYTIQVDQPDPADGETIWELVEHEFEVLGLDTDAQGAPPAPGRAGLTALLVRLWNGILTYRHRARA